MRPPCGPGRRCRECREAGAIVFCSCAGCAAVGNAAHATVSIDDLARAAKVSASTIQRGLRVCVALGLLSCVGPNEYVVHYDAIEARARRDA